MYVMKFKSFFLKFPYSTTHCVYFGFCSTFFCLVTYVSNERHLPITKNETREGEASLQMGPSEMYESYLFKLEVGTRDIYISSE